MSSRPPLVSVGIPTYNRHLLIARAIVSVLRQDYPNVEIVVSDNCSTDSTSSVCLELAASDVRIRYVRQPHNIGATRNFNAVLAQATGEFFMWLGDDDWIDVGYVGSCVKPLICDQTMSLVSGASKYYRDGKKVYEGKLFSLPRKSWWLRVISYYWQVADNGMFYGVMRTEQIRQIEIKNTMGGDWLMIARIVSMGKSEVIPETSIHRELGGASASYQQIAASLGISRIYAIFPMSTIAMSAWLDVVAKGAAYKDHSIFVRLAVACGVFAVIMAKSVLVYSRAAARHIIRLLSKLVG